MLKVHEWPRRRGKHKTEGPSNARRQFILFYSAATLYERPRYNLAIYTLAKERDGSPLSHAEREIGELVGRIPRQGRRREENSYPRDPLPGRGAMIRFLKASLRDVPRGEAHQNCSSLGWAEKTARRSDLRVSFLGIQRDRWN